MACHPGLVTGYVDGELSPSLDQEVERHASGCPVCAGQAAFEIELRDRLRSLPAAVLPALCVRIVATAGAFLRAH